MMERETLFFRKVCEVRHSRDLVGSFLDKQDLFNFRRLFSYVNVTGYARQRSCDNLLSLQKRVTEFMKEKKETRYDAVPLYHLEVLEKSLENLERALMTYVGDIVQTARIPKGMTLLFPEHGPLEGIESRFHEWWIKRPADHHYPYPYGPEHMKIIARHGFPVEPHFNEFSLGGEVPPDYEPYYNIFDDDKIEDYVNF